MTATGHAAVGVALGGLISNPLIGIPVAIVSHIACDLFPHWDSGTARIMGRRKSTDRILFEAIVDVIISFFVVMLLHKYFFANIDLKYLLAMAFSAQFFDYLSMSYFLLRIKKWPFTMVYAWQRAWNKTLDAPWGIINQVAVCILLLVLAKIY